MQNEITQLAIELFKQEIGRNGLARPQSYFEGVAKLSLRAAESFYQQTFEIKKAESKKIINSTYPKTDLVSLAFSSLKKHFDWNADFSEWNIYLNSSEINKFILLGSYYISIDESRIPEMIKKLGSKSVVKRFNGVSKRCYVLPPLAKNEGAKS
jgi:hypothetical protein